MDVQSSIIGNSEKSKTVQSEEQMHQLYGIITHYLVVKTKVVFTACQVHMTWHHYVDQSQHGPKITVCTDTLFIHSSLYFFIDVYECFACV